MLKLNIQLFAEGGSLIIGTEVNTSGIDKGIASIEAKMEKLRKKAEAPYEINGVKVSGDWNLSEKEQQYYDRLATTLNKLEIEKEKMLITDIKIADTINQQANNTESVSNKFNKWHGNTMYLSNGMKVIRKETDALVNATKKIDFSSVNTQIKNLGSSLNNTVKSVAKWGLALFGIRSAYSMIRRAVSLVASENEGISSQIDVMRSAIANALLPLAQSVLNIIAKIMIYINYIYKIITGKNLFDFDKAFQKVSENARKTANGLSSATKSAKELRKTLAGFDEMNILGDNTTSSGGGTSGGSAGGVANIPQIKNPFEGWQNFKIPSWVNKLSKLGKLASDNWRDFAGILSLIGFALGALTGNVGLAVISFIAYLVTQLPTLIDSIKLLYGADSMLEVGLKTVLGIMFPVVGTIVVMADAYNDLTTTTGSTAQASINLRKAQENLKKTQRELNSATTQYKTALENAKKAQKELKEAEKETKLSGEKLYNQVKNGTLSYRDMNDKQKRVYEAYLNNRDAQNQLEESTKKLTEAEKNEKNATKEVEKATLEDTLAKQRAKKDYEGYKNTVIDAYNKGKLKAGEARDYIEQACQDMSDANAETFTKDIPKDIKEGLDTKKYQNSFTKFRNAWNNFISNLKTKLSLNITTSNIGKGIKNIGNEIANIKFAKGGVVYHKLPKLAPGGIINQPGRGVPIASAIGGERGAEGVIPLTDSQQMALLGEAIGRYITVTANITNTMNGRVISKELQKVQNESDFAFNR